MNRILITGAAGFIGANLVRELLKTKNEIHVVIRDTTELWRIKNIIKDCQVSIIDLGKMIPYLNNSNMVVGTRQLQVLSEKGN